MTAVDLSANGGFAQLARAFVDIQAQEFLPLLPAAGVRDLRGALADTGALLLAGVPEEVLLRLVAWRPAPAGPGRDLLPRPAVSQLAQSPGGPGGAPAEQAAEEERQERPARGDIPVRRDGRRACKRTALQAALPENQVESLADLDGAILARSSEGPFSVQGPDMGGSDGGLGLAGVADLPGLGEEGRGEPAEGQVSLGTELFRRGGDLPGALPRRVSGPAPPSGPPALC